MATIQDIENEIIEDFNLFSDWEQRYDYIIDLGKGLAPLDEAYKTEDYLIRGCQSQVWLRAESTGDNVIFYADSDAIITKGIVALLLKVFSGQPAKAILEARLDFIDAIGLREHLSPTRANGLVSMIKQIKNYALAFS